MKAVDALSDKKIRQLQPGETATDGASKGLCVERLADGRFFFRVRYKQTDTGKYTRYSLGQYPATTLQEARDKTALVQAALIQGLDPKEVIEEKYKAIQTKVDDLEEEYGVSFGQVYKEWVAHNHVSGWSPKNEELIIGRLKFFLENWENTPINRIDEKEALRLLRIKYSTAKETSHRAYTLIKDIFRFAVVEKYITTNWMLNISPARDIGKVDEGQRPAIVDPQNLKHLVKAIYNCNSGASVKSALKVALHCFVRSSELRLCTWDELNLDDGLWYIPAKRMKMKEDHIVPLSSQMVEVFKELETIRTGDLVFPSPVRNRPLSNTILNMTIKRMGFDGTNLPEQSLHGLRATARTIIDEQLRFPFDIIEHQLAHKVKDPLGRSYNRTTKIEDRKVMMQAYSDYLESL